MPLLQDDGFVAVAEHAPLGVPLDGTVQHDCLELAADDRQGLRLLGVIDALDLLLDDRALVEVGRHVMRRRADELHPPACAWW